MDFASRLDQLPLIGIVRGISDGELPTLAQAVEASGLGLIEITLNTANAPAKIAALRELAQERFTVGAGTVLDVAGVEAAYAAGAQFIVSPVLVPAVVERSLALGLAVLPGALTPQEVYNAHSAGATLVKVFPAQFFGPMYLRELLGPLDSVRLLACGGVTADTAPSYLTAGASGLAVGASVFRRDWLNSANVAALSSALSGVIRSVHMARGTAPAVPSR